MRGFIQYLYRHGRAQLSKHYRYYQLEKANPSCKFYKPYSVINPRLLDLGENVMIKQGCFLHCGGMEWSNGRGCIKLCDSTYLGENSILYGAGIIVIGSKSRIGPGVKIFSSREIFEDNIKLAERYETTGFHALGKVIVGDNSIVFSNVVISPGVTIGEGAVIGAGSVVTKDIPPWTVAYGAPARVIKKR